MSRRGTEVRQRTRQVAVRLLPEEMAMLLHVVERDGVSPGEALRRAFLREVGVDEEDFLRETYDLVLRLRRLRALDLSAALGISAQNANNRLKRLVDIGVLRREPATPKQGGKEFVYTVVRA
jgi:hypothetical protein